MYAVSRNMHTKLTIVFGAAVLLCILNNSDARSLIDSKTLSGESEYHAQVREAVGKVGDPLPHVIRIGAFNIKTFGRAKMSDAEVAGYITQIVLRYDAILIQEIRDISQESVIQLWSMVNQTRSYGLSISERLGRTSYKEQYAYFYRLDRLTLTGVLQYNDDAHDLFEREPYSVRFRPVGSGAGWDFALIGIHAKPDHAVDEMRNLIDVYDDVIQTWTDVKDIVLLGDFNAACSYASEPEITSLPIYTQSMFQWLIGSDVDTTTSTGTTCAYDRIVVSGPNLPNAVVPGSAGIYKFEDVFKLDYNRMRDVSDHYPVEFEIY